MSFTFRPATRENTPLIIGIAGPTKSGKTYSALRLAIGLANDAPIAMINAEGARGHQYADKFTYMACDIQPPYSPERYTETLIAAAAIKPGVVIIDSCSHMHDGPGGLLEYHDAELQRIAGNDQAKRDRANFTAWIRPKAAENKFIYTMLGMKCPMILCFRAKEKLKIVTGKPPIDLGWQPVAGERITFETLFTVMLPPRSKGVPDLSISEMREPFDSMIPEGKPIDEDLGRRLTEWAKGAASDRKTTYATDKEISWLRSEFAKRLHESQRDKSEQFLDEFLMTEGVKLTDEIQLPDFRELAKRAINQAKVIAALAQEKSA